MLLSLQANLFIEGEDNAGTITEQMVRSVEHYPIETIVAVNAKLRKAIKRVKNATIHDYELEVFQVHKIGDLTENVPFTVYDAENINRDKEDAEDDEDVDSLAGMYPSGGADTPSNGDNTPRASTDLSRVSVEKSRKSVDRTRVSKDNFASRSKNALLNHCYPLTIYR